MPCPPAFPTPATGHFDPMQIGISRDPSTRHTPAQDHGVFSHPGPRFANFTFFCPNPRPRIREFLPLPLPTHRFSSTALIHTAQRDGHPRGLPFGRNRGRDFHRNRPAFRRISKNARSHPRVRVFSRGSFIRRGIVFYPDPVDHVVADSSLKLPMSRGMSRQSHGRLLLGRKRVLADGKTLVRKS
jgi:hypothetical protein